MASANKQVSLKDLKADITKYVGAVMSGTAGRIRDELTNEAALSIAKFYNDYDPIYYHRHYYNFTKNSFEKYYVNAHGNIYHGGVRLTPEKMDDIYQDPTQEVFDSVYAGFHGVSSMFETPYSFTVTRVMKPSPMELIYKKRDDIVRNIDKYLAYGKEKAKKQSYSTITVR